MSFFPDLPQKSQFLANLMMTGANLGMHFCALFVLWRLLAYILSCYFYVSSCCCSEFLFKEGSLLAL